MVSVPSVLRNVFFFKPFLLNNLASCSDINIFCIKVFSGFDRNRLTDQCELFFFFNEIDISFRLRRERENENDSDNQFPILEAP